MHSYIRLGCPTPFTVAFPRVGSCFTHCLFFRSKSWVLHIYFFLSGCFSFIVFSCLATSLSDWHDTFFFCFPSLDHSLLQRVFCRVCRTQHDDQTWWHCSIVSLCLPDNNQSQCGFCLCRSFVTTKLSPLQTIQVITGYVNIGTDTDVLNVHALKERFNVKTHTTQAYIPVDIQRAQCRADSSSQRDGSFVRSLTRDTKLQ